MPSKVPYIIGDETFQTKEELIKRCQGILAATPNGGRVDLESAKLLFALFQFHDEWSAKANGGVHWITVQTSSQGTRCFYLVKQSGLIDISFHHAIRQLPSSRTAFQLPQALRDFRNAARAAIQDQIFAFRDSELRRSPTCPFTRELLTRANCAVDHVAPKTFDQLLFNFCLEHNVDPLQVSVGSIRGTVPTFINQQLHLAWTGYHRMHAVLRILSETGNLQLPKMVMPWAQVTGRGDFGDLVAQYSEKLL